MGMSPAERYAELRAGARVAERALFLVPRQPNELELQARWFAGDFGRRFHSTDGREVEVVQFGIWNREAGPDFQGAAIRIAGGEIRTGSIEFDLSDRSWEAHGHSTNPAFEDTVLHVFVNASEQAFFTRTLSHRHVLQVRVDPAKLPDAYSSNVPLARPGRCQAPLSGLPAERVLGVIDAAARFRLQRKAARLLAMSDAHGAEDALFQETAGALGYKQNKLPLTLLAQRASLRALRANPTEAEAILFGLAGFLEAPDLSVYERETRSYVRRLWDQWWPHRDELQRLIVPRETWRFSGARPMNHPERRVAALAALVREWNGWMRSLGSADPLPSARSFLLKLRHPYWNHHYTLTSDAAPKEMALVGDSRIAEIIANVLVPYFHGQGKDLWSEYEKLAAKLSNRRLETAVTRLFDDDPRRSEFVRTVARQQGLLQIYEDFCLQDNSDCAHCPFPEQMRKWT
ncbi:MAG TPA: DUF2851 family protein [Chthoniobacterales bacterium]|nr:DUF2851 family protein [Chthoniobacterales bacterium]